MPRVKSSEVVRKAAKKVTFLVARPLRGWGVKCLATNKKITFIEALKKSPKNVATALEVVR